MGRRAFPRLKLEAWPAQDATRWRKAKLPKKLFAERSAADWRPSTRQSAESGFGIYLGWLSAQGRLDPDTAMEERVTPALIEQFAEDYSAGRAPLTLAGQIRDIAMMLRACRPPDGLPWLTELAWRLMNAAKPVKSKLPHIASPGELLALAAELMAEGRALLEGGRSAGGLMYRDGLMIASLMSRPMRLGEFVSLRLGHTLFRRKEHWQIDIPPASTKTKRRRRQTFPRNLAVALDYFVDHVRSGLPHRALDIDEGWLWLGRDGPLRPTSISNTITAATRKRLGKAISPHRFRDCAATAIALTIPEHIGITRTILGHATLRSSQEHYNQAHSYSASADLADVVERLRKQA